MRNFFARALRFEDFASHAAVSVKRCLSLAIKRFSSHVLSHSCALAVLEATKDLRKVLQWDSPRLLEFKGPKDKSGVLCA